MRVGFTIVSKYLKLLEFDTGFPTCVRRVLFKTDFKSKGGSITIMFKKGLNAMMKNFIDRSMRSKGSFIIRWNTLQ